MVEAREDRDVIGMGMIEKLCSGVLMGALVTTLGLRLDQGN